MAELGALAQLLRDYGPWGLLALSLWANLFQYRRGEAVHAAYQLRSEQMFADRIKAAETIIAAHTASTAATAAAMTALNDSLERLRVDLPRRGG